MALGKMILEQRSRSNCPSARKPKEILSKAKDISDELASRDVARYFDSIMTTESATQGRLLTKPFNPRLDAIVLDYTENPSRIEVLDLRSVSEYYPNVPAGVDHWAELAAERNCIMYLIVYKLPEGLRYKLTLNYLEEFWKRASSFCGHRWKGGPSTAIGRRDGLTTEWLLEPRVDAIEDLLAHCGSSLGEFLESDFEKKVLDWYKVSLQGMSEIFYSTMMRDKRIWEEFR